MFRIITASILGLKMFIFWWVVRDPKVHSKIDLYHGSSYVNIGKVIYPCTII